MRRQAPELVEFGRQNELTEIVMSTSTLIETPAAQDERATLFVGFELGKATWLIGLYAPELGRTVSRYKIDGGDLGKVLELIAAMRRQLEKLGKPVRMVSIYEAGYDGFWLHRALRAAGIDNRVIDAASVPVDRRARRVKTDRLDLEQLICMLLALERGETRACRVVRVSSPAEEDAKRQHRERLVLVAERTRHGNRITGLLMALGIRGVNPRCRDFVAHLQTLRTGDGEPLPPHTKQALTREHERLLLDRAPDQGDRGNAGCGGQSRRGNDGTAAGSGRGGGQLHGSRPSLPMRLKSLNRISALVSSHEVPSAPLRQPPGSRQLFRADTQSRQQRRQAQRSGDRQDGQSPCPDAGQSSPGCGSDISRAASWPSGSWNGPAAPPGASGASPSSPWRAS